MKKNRICLCCSHHYSYCNTCSHDANKPLWYSIYCSENCKNLFQAASDYFMDKMSKDEALKAIENADLSKKDKFSDGIKKFINEVMPDANKSKPKAMKKTDNKKVEIKTETKVETKTETKEEVKPSVQINVQQDNQTSQANQNNQNNTSRMSANTNVNTNNVNVNNRNNENTGNPGNGNSNKTWVFNKRK